MPKFKVGDKIEFEMDGKKVSGTITRDYNSPGHAMYDVRVGTKTMTIADTPMRPANACKNAKFKVGDKVTDGSGVYLITGIDNGFGSYEWKLISGRADPSHSKGGDFGWADAKMNIANACKNAKIVTPENFGSLRVGDKVDFRKSRYYKGIGVVTKVYDEDIIDIKDDKGEILEVHSDDIMNARACNSRNPVVAKALNACARNGIDDLNFDMKGVYQTAKKLLAAGAKHISGYKWSIPGDMEYGANIIASKVGGGVKRIQPDPNKAGFVIAEITDPLAQALERKGVMNACGTARNAVTITRDSRKRDGWVTGKVNGYDFEAKVFDEGSDFGIKSGRVSKLWMRKGDETVNYDRGWDERPKSAEAKAAYTELLRKMESLPKVTNACGTARNGSLGEDAALGISYAREAVAKLNSAVPLVEKWIASGKGWPSAVADGKRLVAGIKKAVAILNPLV